MFLQQKNDICKIVFYPKLAYLDLFSEEGKTYVNDKFEIHELGDKSFSKKLKDILILKNINVNAVITVDINIHCYKKGEEFCYCYLDKDYKPIDIILTNVVEDFLGYERIMFYIASCEQTAGHKNLIDIGFKIRPKRYTYLKLYPSYLVFFRELHEGMGKSIGEKVKTLKGFYIEKMSEEIEESYQSEILVRELKKKFSENNDCEMYRKSYKNVKVFMENSRFSNNFVEKKDFKIDFLTSVMQNIDDVLGWKHLEKKFFVDLRTKNDELVDGLPEGYGIYPVICDKGSDCYVVYYKHNNVDKIIVVDGGYHGSFPNLWKLLKNLRKIDLWVLTHRDSDHSEGFVHFFNHYDEKDGIFPKVDYVMYRNNFYSIIGNKDNFSGKEVVRKVFHKIRSKQNKIVLIDPDINSNLVDVLEKKFPEVKVLKRYSNLKKFYKSYRHTSKENIASLSLELLLEGKHCLFTGDIHEDFILDKVHRGDFLGECVENGNVFFSDLPHHGSKHSCTGEFFEKIKAKIYVVTGYKRGSGDLPSKDVKKCLDDPNDRKYYIDISASASATNDGNYRGGEVTVRKKDSYYFFPL